MNGKTSGGGGARRAGAVAAVAAVAVLTAACGAVHVSFGGAASGDPSGNPSPGNTALGGPVTFTQELALARCMRSHGATDLPDPNPSSGFNLTTAPNGPTGSVDIDSSQIQAAYGACRHLLSGGGPSVAELQQDAQQEQQEEQKELPALLKFAQCMRGHGVPDFPDPSTNGQATPALPEGAGINPSSPRFQAAVTACQHVLPAGAHLHFSAHESTRSS